MVAAVVDPWELLDGDVVTLRTIGWNRKVAAEICSERVSEMVAKFFRSTEMLRQESLGSKLKSRMSGLVDKSAFRVVPSAAGWSVRQSAVGMLLIGCSGD